MKYLTKKSDTDNKINKQTLCLNPQNEKECYIKKHFKLEIRNLFYAI